MTLMSRLRNALGLSRPDSSPSLLSDHPEVAEVSSTRFAELRRAIRGKGHPAFPFLSPVYSPGSRVPCTDFTPWIVDALSGGDTDAVKELMANLVAGNPGVGDGRDWTTALVADVLRSPFERYVVFSENRAYTELRAMLILYGLDGGGEKGFSLATGRGRELASLIACHCPDWRLELVELSERANSFIRAMRRDTPFWRDYPLFEALPSVERAETPIDLVLRRLSPAARLDLFLAIGERAVKTSRFGSGGPFGHDTEFSREQLEREGLLNLVRDDDVVKNLWGKEELLDICRREGIAVKSSWKKETIARTLAEGRPELVEGRLRTEAPVAVPPDVCNQVSIVRHTPARSRGTAVCSCSPERRASSTAENARSALRASRR